MKKVLIIGGGIAGLSAGCHLQMNGYETEIFEMHSEAGGLCASWKRQDYIIDGCIHWLVGCSPADDGHYRIWDSLIDMKSLPTVIYEEFCSVEHEGKSIRLYADADRLNQHLKSIAPEDSKAIDALTKAIKKFASLKMPMHRPSEIMTFKEKLVMGWQMIPLLAALLKWKISAEKFSKRFKNKDIRYFLKTVLGNKTPMSIWLLNASWFYKKDSGYPIGGAKELVRRLVKRYESLGGTIHYRSKVAKIIVKEDAAKAIMLEDGSKYNADIVISAADGRTTVLQMLEGNYRDKSIDRLYYSGVYEPKSSGLYVTVGIARRFTESYKPYVYFDLKKPITVDGQEIKTLGVTIHNFDPTAAPEGKTVLTVLVKSHDPKYWISLRSDNLREYKERKEAVARQVIDALDDHFKDIKIHLEMIDVATPATFARYTDNWNGALMGWTDPKLLLYKPKKTIKGLKNFYMCGQWTADTGLPGAVMSGWSISQIICKRDGKEFNSLPT